MQALSRFMFECERIFILDHWSATHVREENSVDSSDRQLTSDRFIFHLFFITQNNCKISCISFSNKIFLASSQWYRYDVRSDEQLQSQSPLNMGIGNVDFYFNICRCLLQLAKWFIIAIECGLNISCSMIVLVCIGYWNSNDAFSWNEFSHTAPSCIL